MSLHLCVQPAGDLQVVGSTQLTGEVLGVDVVEQLSDVTHMEDVEVQQIVTVH